MAKRVKFGYFVIANGKSVPVSEQTYRTICLDFPKSVRKVKNGAPIARND